VTTTNTERERFEAWAASEGFNIDRDESEKYRDYHRATTRWAWQAWQARAALASQQAAPAPQSCQHKRYSVDVQEQTGRCYDCGAEGRMQFVVPVSQQAPADVPGFALVPIEPTPEMALAFWSMHDRAKAPGGSRRTDFRGAYSAMLAASPLPPQKSQGDLTSASSETVQARKDVVTLGGGYPGDHNGTKKWRVPGMVWMVAFGGSKEVRGMFDTSEQAHAFVASLDADAATGDRP
jgi:hypothetical protein